MVHQGHRMRHHQRDHSPANHQGTENKAHRFEPNTLPSSPLNIQSPPKNPSHWTYSFWVPIRGRVFLPNPLTPGPAFTKHTRDVACCCGARRRRMASSTAQQSSASPMVMSTWSCWRYRKRSKGMEAWYQKPGVAAPRNGALETWWILAPRRKETQQLKQPKLGFKPPN